MRRVRRSRLDAEGGAGFARRSFVAPRRTFASPRSVSSTSTAQTAQPTSKNVGVANTVSVGAVSSRTPLRPLASTVACGDNEHVDQKKFEVAKRKAPITLSRGVFRNPKRLLVHQSQQPSASGQAPVTVADNDAASRVFTCLYYKFTRAKKKKYFDGFVILMPSKKKARLLDPEGKQIAQQRTSVKDIAVDTLFSFGNWDAEVRIQSISPSIIKRSVQWVTCCVCWSRSLARVILSCTRAGDCF